MVGFSLFIIWFFLAIISYIKNRDILSPAKYYLFNIGLYFAAIFYKPYSVSIYFVYLLFLIIGFILIIFEPINNDIKYNKVDKRNFSYLNKFNMRRAFRIIWFLSIIPIGAQLYLIYYMGGLQGYINKLGLRVVEWQGMGIVLEMINLFSILNIFYFSLMICYSKPKKFDWLKYLLHFIVLLTIGFLSGSRGGLLSNIVLMVIVYNYLRSKISIKAIATIAIVLILVASVLGIARNGYKLTDEGFSSGITNNDELFSLEHFEYGITPLELIYSSSSPLYELQYGFTFLTPVTNLIPRKIWPNKPDTGGLVFTKIYTGNAWGGYSNLAPGIIGEGVINFGRTFGTLAGIAIFMAVMFWVYLLYKRITSKLSSEKINLKTIALLVFYSFVITTVPGLVQSEWTNTMLSVFLKGIKLLFIYIIILKFPNFTLYKKSKIGYNAAPSGGKS
ncbi:O-antigen polymerase [Bacillus sp. 1P02SD]|uniref:O-antigen polymerase n=1 Tax=Bacillus sp. 1P02SD TaxID=3132264 RepID=UPI0039A17958